MKPERQETRDIFKSHILLAPLFERLFGLRRCAAIYDELVSCRGERDFPAHVLEGMGIGYDLADEEFGRIPAQGPLVVIANHPFGGVEGLILLDLLRRVRPDVRVLANSLLCRIPELREAVIPVDPFGGRSAVAANRTPLREAVRWVRGGGALLIFPAGEVAHFSLGRREICDPPWSPQLAHLLRACAAPVLPVFFPGRNGLLFQLAGFLHPRLRTALLPREFLNKTGRRFPLRVGHVVPWKKPAALADDRELMDYLRLKTYLLGCGGGGDGPPAESGDGSSPAKAEMEPVILPQSPAILVEEIRRLPQSQLLAESGGMQVFQARAAQIPYALLEIGRLRELTFAPLGRGPAAVSISTPLTSITPTFSFGTAMPWKSSAPTVWARPMKSCGSWGRRGFIPRPFFISVPGCWRGSAPPWKWGAPSCARSTSAATPPCCCCGKGSAATSAIIPAIECCSDR